MVQILDDEPNKYITCTYCGRDLAYTKNDVRPDGEGSTCVRCPGCSAYLPVKPWSSP